MNACQRALSQNRKPALSTGASEHASVDCRRKAALSVNLAHFSHAMTNLCVSGLPWRGLQDVLRLAVAVLAHAP